MEKYKLSISILVTLAGWLIVTTIYGYLWVNHIFKTEPLYGHERSRLLISTGFIAYRLPYLLVALIVLIVLELIFVPLVKSGRRS